MSDRNLEPTVFIFPLPPDLKAQYLKWANSFQFNEKALSDLQEKGSTPIFIPVYPGVLPYPPNCPVNPAGTPCGGATAGPPGVNPYSLFLILILLLLSFKKDQILSAIRRLLLKTSKADPSENPALESKGNNLEIEGGVTS
jgi:hypothetical protein